MADINENDARVFIDAVTNYFGHLTGEAAVMRMGLTYFLLSAIVASIVIAYCATLYLDFVINRSK